jgi:hypothetical protein
MDFNQYSYNLGVAQLIFYVSVGLVKLSIALFVRRLANQASNAWKIFIDTFMGTLFIYLSLAVFCKLIKVLYLNYMPHVIFLFLAVVVRIANRT